MGRSFSGRADGRQSIRSIDTVLPTLLTHHETSNKSLDNVKMLRLASRLMRSGHFQPRVLIASGIPMYALLRQVHMYLGLLSWTFLLILGIAGLTNTFRYALGGSRGEPQVRM